MAARLMKCTSALWEKGTFSQIVFDDTSLLGVAIAFVLLQYQRGKKNKKSKALSTESLRFFLRSEFGPFSLLLP